MKKIERALERGASFYRTVSPFLANYFRRDYLIIDVGAGNGCLGMFWPNYVYFVDRKMPATFGKVSTFFSKRNFSYHESAFQDFPTAGIDAPKAFAGMHSCGELSDLIISRAILERAPLAIVPCCHYSAALDYQGKLAHSNPSLIYYNNYPEYVDELRRLRLLESGFNCQVHILEGIRSTHRRLILAFPN